MKKAQNIARLHIATPEALRQAVQEAASMRMQSANSYVRQALREAPIAVCARVSGFQWAKTRLRIGNYTDGYAQVPAE
jgi:hypothetical protein